VAIYLGTATPSDYKLGSNAVSKVYLGSTQVWPVGGSSALLTMTRSNNGGVITGWTISGNTFTRADPFAIDDANGLAYYTWTAGGSATVTVSFQYSDDSESGQSNSINRTRSGSTTSSTSSSNVTGFTVSVISGDVITITATGDQSQQFFTNVSVSAA
jgi:hypothetical protein